ncbi:DNA translocase FtsK [Paracoccus suum]|uniref:DNA translocase FtsK n=1 Tax=Paracoccus suum TaxID=2259340 RepID=A0A344PHH5_9RHOB|nr:DNA translocase FtsK [Paracoccus suum]AXC48830.1 DNA translocase FtsK [Paracoccus suum]
MASWQAKHRDPLFDQNTQAALERRGKELVGAVLITLGIAVAMMLASFSPDDPGFLAATDQPAANWLGGIGAYVASALLMIAGKGAWALVAGGLVWGLRLMTHRGEDRVMRAIFLPILVALVSVWATAMTPPTGWTPNYGLGGHFGDMVTGAILNMLPLPVAIGIRFLEAGVAIATLVFGAFVLGFDRRELLSVGRFLAAGLATAYAMAMTVFGRGAVASVAAARGVQAKAAARRTRKIEGEVSGAALADAMSGDAPRRGLLSRLRPAAPVLEPELVEDEVEWDGTAPEPESIRSSVLAAVTARLSRPKPVRAISNTGSAGDWSADDLDDTDVIVPNGPAAAPFGEGRSRVVVAPSRAPAPSRQARAEAQPQLPLSAQDSHYERPPLSLLSAAVPNERYQLSQEALMENARMLEAVLDDYGVKGQITEVRPGPVVTLYELEPAPGLKASRVIGLSDDIARSMSALSARVSTVPGRTVIGIELPNARREKVVLREILAARAYGDGTQPLPLALGKDIGGEPVVANLAKMPHLLIAGTTGSGKSVAINTMILSLLYKLTPEECRLIMIDPKMLELSVYDGIPHLLSPVVTDPKKAVVALKWVVGEMEDRYRRMSKMGVRNIEGYNGRVREALAKGEMFRRTVQTGFDEDTGEPVFHTEEFMPESVPYIVVIVDEMADLMMVAGKEIEACIQRLAQMARASGIHLIMATQRPSVDVITGTIKANFPTRISFQVTSKIDSRTILGEQGAEQLLGQGDMLYMAGGSKITRVHGPFVSDEEVEEIVTHLKSFGPPSYMSGVVSGGDNDSEVDIDAVLGLGGDGGDDQLYDQAVAIVAKDRKCSTSYIQRKLAIGYNKAARLVEQMEEQGVVSTANHVGKREVLVPEV